MADVLVQPGEEVWGILYSVSKEDLKLLDRFEGVPTAYRRCLLDVWKYSLADNFLDDLLTAMENGDPRQIEPEDYVRFEKIEAHVYEVVNKSMGCYPDIKYLDILLDAAYENHFPGEYIEKLATFGKKDIAARSALAIDHLLTLKEMVLSGRWPIETENEPEWGGAELVLTGNLKRKKELNKYFPQDLVILTPHWQKLSWLVRNIYHHPSIKWQINSANKYGLLEELGMAITAYQHKYPNDQEVTGLAEALIQKAYEKLTH